MAPRFQDAAFSVAWKVFERPLGPRASSPPSGERMEEAPGTSDSLSAPSTPLSQLVYENRDSVAALRERVLHLEERLHSAENQISSNNRRLTWIEQFLQRLRNLAAQLC